MKQIGVTETYDPVYVPDWDKKLVDSNIIITKELSDDMIYKLLANKDKCILHMTCTGLGSSEYEPNVPDVRSTIEKCRMLFMLGFPIEHFVLRIDPIIPTFELLNKVIVVLDNFKELLNEFDTDRIRCIVSVIDMYPHVRRRFMNANIPLPFKGWNADDYQFELVNKLLVNYTDTYDFQSCAESKLGDFINRVGCVSTIDLKVLDQELSDYNLTFNGSRNTCLCIHKKNILGVRPSQCPHKCIYCFWR